jgi:very-short-patch-repair endonuclease
VAVIGDRRVAAIAARQHGVVSRPQLAEVGIDDRAISRRVEEGRLHRIHQGVYAVGHPGLTQHGRWMAAVLACGEDSVLSHFDAAVLWRINDGSGPRVHVLTRANRRVAGLRIHRARRLDPDDVTTNDGIPVTTVARTLVDLTDVLPAERVRRAIREAEFQQLLDHAALIAAVERARGRHRLRVLREALREGRARGVIRSELEHRFLELLRSADLPEPETNVRIPTRRRVYEVDCLWRAQGVVAELDGRAAHTRTTAFEEDRKRDTALNAIGLRPLRFTWERVTADADEVIAELRETLSGAGGERAA